MAFLAGNITKIPTGGWVPLAFAVVMFTMFITWRDGRQALRAELEKRAVPDKKLPELLEGKARVPGTAVFLVSQSGFVPTALLRNLDVLLRQQSGGRRPGGPSADDNDLSPLRNGCNHGPPPPKKT